MSAPCFSQNESLHAQTEFSCSVGILFLSEFTLSNNSLSSTTTAQENNPLPSLWLGRSAAKPRANSFSDRSRWTSCPPRPFLSSFRPLLSLYTHAKSLFGSCRCPRLPIQRIFFSPAKILFFPPPKSLSLRLAPSSSSPDVGKFVCLCRQLTEYSLYALQGFFSPSIALLQTKSKHTAVPSLFKLKISSIRPVRSVSPLSHSHYTCLGLLWCNQPIGQETTVSSDCASSRLETSWAELYCHIITP